MTHFPARPSGPIYQPHGDTLVPDTDEEPSPARAERHRKDAWAVLALLFGLTFLLSAGVAGFILGERAGYTQGEKQEYASLMGIE